MSQENLVWWVERLLASALLLVLLTIGFFEWLDMQPREIRARIIGER